MRALNVPEAIESAGKATRDMSQLLANGPDAAGALKLRQSALQRDLTVSNLGRLRFEPPAGPFTRPPCRARAYRSHWPMSGIPR